MFNYETSISAAKSVTHRKGLQATVTFLLKVGGLNVMRCTQKSQNSVVASIVPVTVVPPTLIQEPMWLGRRKRRFLKAPWSLTIPPSFVSFTSYRYFFLSLLVGIYCNLIPDWIGSNRARILFSAQYRTGIYNKIQNTTLISISKQHSVIRQQDSLYLDYLIATTSLVGSNRVFPRS